jgi:ribosomal-protein-alanine N-acetyltransferase
MSRADLLETERLRLRRARSDDIPVLMDLWSDPDITRFMGGPRKAAELRVSFEEDVADSASHRFDLWPVEEKATGEIVGHCGLIDKVVDGKAEIELVYVFAKRTWGQGYATEITHALRDHAFGPMVLPRLISLIEPENVASERVALKVGMSLEKEVVGPGGAIRRVYAMEREAERSAAAV